jgi:precorrin-2 dehydrogenase/sirohydrochlorin ferrochelatase
VEGYALAICATDDARVNRQVFEEAESRNIPVNVVDVPALCRFIVPSALRQGDLCIAVSTGGKSPALARKIRRELEAQFGPEYATLLELLGRYRSRMKARFPEDFESRARAWEYLVASDLLDLIREGKVDEAEHRVATCISH